MKNLYAIITCKKNHELRAAMQRTWCASVNHVWLTSDYSNGDDSYISCPKKVLGFFQKEDLSCFDNVIICDDDTFVFVKRLELFLSNLSKTRYVIAHWGSFQNDKPSHKIIAGPSPKTKIRYPRGGSGMILEKSVVHDLVSYLKNTPAEKLTLESHSDTTLGIWLSMLQDIDTIELKHLMHPGSAELVFNNHEIMSTAFTLHYVKPEQVNLLQTIAEK